MKSKLFLVLFFLIGVHPVFCQFDEKPVALHPSSTLMEEILERMEYDYSSISYNKYKLEINGYTSLLLIDDDDIQLYSVFEYSGSLNRINDWNRTKKFSRAYMDMDGDAILESEISFEGGLTAKAITNFITTYLVSLLVFVDHIN